MTPQPEIKSPPFRGCWGVQWSCQCLAVSNMSVHRGIPGSTYLLITAGTEQFLICSVVAMKRLVQLSQTAINIILDILGYESCCLPVSVEQYGELTLAGQEVPTNSPPSQQDSRENRAKSSWDG